MTFTVEFAQDGRYVIIRMMGNITTARMRKATKAAHDKGVEAGINNFLFDMRNGRNVESVAANYQYAYHDMRNLDFSRSARAALLTAPDDRSHDFMETLCRNAGYNVRVFTDLTDAVAWLKSGNGDS